MSVAVMYGGVSCEHDISIITATQLAGALPTAKKIYIDEDNKWWLVRNFIKPLEYKKRFARTPVTILPNDNRLYVKLGLLLIPICRLDCAVMCFHGLNGEDGSVQGLLQLSGIPFTCSDIAPSSIGIDKSLAKIFFRGLGLPVVDDVIICDEEYFSNPNIIRERIADLSYPLIAKPCSLGSSIGINVAHNFDELTKALDIAFQFDSKVIIEHVVKDCHEANCSYLADIGVSEVYQPLSSGEILSFADKYMSGDKLRPKKELLFTEEIRNATELLCRAMGVKGVARVDFLVNNEGYFVNEINTIPGSLAYPMWQDKLSLSHYVGILIDNARSQFRLKSSLVYRYQSNVLSQSKIKK